MNPQLIVQERLSQLTFKQQSALLTALRGPDKHSPQTKLVVHMVRRATLNDDGSDEAARFFGRLVPKPKRQPSWKKLREELESLPTHYVKHLAEAMCVVGELTSPSTKDRELYALGQKVMEKVL